MNSLVFNSVAEQLRTSVYGLNQNTGKLQLLQLNAAGELLVAGDVTITNTLLTVAGDVTVTNTLLTVAGDVTVTKSLLTVAGDVTVTKTILTVAGDVTVTNTLLTVAGDVTVTNTLLTVAGDVTVTNTLLTVAGDVTVTNTLLTVAGDLTITNTLLTVAGDVTIAGNLFTSTLQTLGNVTSTGIALPATDISTLRTATMFINNTGSTPLTVTLQLSPDGTAYFNDPNYTDVSVQGTSYTVIVADIFAHFIQLEYDAGATPTTFLVYYNGQA